MKLMNVAILLVMVCVFLSVQAGENSQIVNYPLLRVESDSIDLGNLVAGERANGEVKVYNDGGKDLLIGRVRSSCGLMIPTWPGEAITPGEEAIIRFRYNTSRQGPFVRNIIIHTNGHPKTTVVRVTGNVVPAAESSEETENME